MDYVRIPSSATSIPEDVPEDSSQDKLRTPQRMKYWSLLAAIFAILITAFNIAFLNVQIVSRRSQSTPSRRLSTYIGLDQLIRNASSPDWPRTRYGFPDYLGNIDSSVPEEIQPSAHRVRLDSVHTLVIQFTVHDFGLQSCAVSSFFPDQSHFPLDRYSRSSHVEELEVWLLDNRGKTDSRSRISWSTKPARIRQLGRLNATLPHDNTSFFHYPSGSTQLFEIICRSKSCVLDLQQVRPGRKLGFWMLQSEVETV